MNSFSELVEIYAPFLCRYGSYIVPASFLLGVLWLTNSVKFKVTSGTGIVGIGDRLDKYRRDTAQIPRKRNSSTMSEVEDQEDLVFQESPTDKTCTDNDCEPQVS